MAARQLRVLDAPKGLGKTCQVCGDKTVGSERRRICWDCVELLDDVSPVDRTLITDGIILFLCRIAADRVKLLLKGNKLFSGSLTQKDVFEKAIKHFTSTLPAHWQCVENAVFDKEGT